MTKSYFRGASGYSCLRQLGLTALLLGSTLMTARAQFAYAPEQAAFSQGTYADLGTAGTAIATANTDDANSAAQPIGFSFTYNGTAFTQFVLNTNGLLRLGAAAPASAAASPPYAQELAINPFNSTDPANVNLVAPFNADLIAGTAGAEYRVATTGAAGSRICTIQWKNVADKPIEFTSDDNTVLPTQYSNFSFQVKLYEGSNLLEFVYDAPQVNTIDAIKAIVVGVKGAGSAAGQNVFATKASSADWDSDNVTFATGAVELFTSFRFRAQAPPAAGATLRFTPLKANDVAVSAIHTYGTLATDVNLPHAVKAVITNQGYNTQTNLVATLRVSGANTLTSTQTIRPLGKGDTATVTFDRYPTNLVLGTNVVTVTIPADDDDTNNSKTYGQLITPNRVSYYNSSRPSSDSVGIGVSGALGSFAAKYKLATPTTLTSVTVGLANSPDPATNYQIVIYQPGAEDGLPDSIIYKSPVQTRPAGRANPVLALPNVTVPATFFIAVQELDNPIYLRYQNQYPLPADSHYYAVNAADWASFNFDDSKAGFLLDIGFTTAPVTCRGPVGPSAGTITATGASISFDIPTNGAGSYQVVYGPVGFDPATAGTTVTATASPAVLTGLNPATTYQVYLRGNCAAAGTSVFTNPLTFTTSCAANPVITQFPYRQDFELLAAGQSLPCGFAALDANGDGATWAATKVNPGSGLSAVRYTSAFSNSVAADDWLFTPALSLTPGTRYQVAFRYRAEGVLGNPSPYVEKLEVKTGPTATPAGQTTPLYTNADITNTSYETADAAATPAVATFTATAGTQYLGFHVYSDARQGNLYLDDLNVTASVVTATSSAALLRAVSVFPNPSTTGVFDLEIHGANAKGNLEVLVTNTLGQQVYTGSARDNYTNRLDLSGLAPGLYHLRVRHGAETLTRQLAIAK